VAKNNCCFWQANSSTELNTCPRWSHAPPGEHVLGTGSAPRDCSDVLFRAVVDDCCCDPTTLRTFFSNTKKQK